MMLSRTRKQIKNMESFYKEAGLDQEIENIYEKNVGSEIIGKKERMLIKKFNKQELVNKAEVKTTSDKLQSDASQESVKDVQSIPNICNMPTRSSEQSTPALQKIINKISILQVIQSKIVNGCYGHTTVIFKRPVIEGQYYLEFKILKANLNDSKAKIKNQPAIRIGLCPADYPKNTPLGQNVSIGCKTSNGKLIYDGAEQEQGEGFVEGDVIGLGLKFSPPDKYQDNAALWEQSQILISKNGKTIQTCNKIYQIFYCPAFSLYNYASVQVRYDKNNIQHLMQGFKPYASIFNQEVNYEHLKNTAQFSPQILGIN